MKSGFNSQCMPSYRLLTIEQIKELHTASLEILETIGVKLDHEEAVQMLADAGCKVKNNDQVFIPNWLVEECINSAPSGIIVYNQIGEEALRLEGRNAYYGMGTDLPKTWDLETGELRQSTLKDVKNNAIIADYLDDIDFIGSMALPYDVPTNSMYIESFRTELENSNKPIFYTAAAREDSAIIIEMAEAVAGGEAELQEKPFLINYSEPLSPLSHSFGALQKLFLCAEKRLPVCYTPAMLSGASGPVTLAGAIATANAEALSGIVIHQLKQKGAPIISGFIVCTMDMATSTATYATPEQQLTKSACTDIFHYYDLPVWSTSGSDSNTFDQQAGLENSIHILLSGLDGANLIHDIGFLGQGLICSPVSLVICSEYIRYAKRILRGFEINKDSLAIDIIRKVGSGGNFIAEDHTAEYLRSEHFIPQLLCRQDSETWISNGGKTLWEKATEEAKNILATHIPVSKSFEVIERLMSLSRRAEKELAGISFTA